MSQLSEDINLLGRALGQVISEQEGAKFYALEERVRKAAKTYRNLDRHSQELGQLLKDVSPEDAERLVRAFLTYFQLVNLAEEQQRVRSLERQQKPRKQSFEELFLKLKEEGKDAGAAEALFSSLYLGLTFTAHPTEMRRRTVRVHLERIAQLIPALRGESGLAKISADAYVQIVETPQVPLVHWRDLAGVMRERLGPPHLHAGPVQHNHQY